jgi:hypothetical protein
MIDHAAFERILNDDPSMITPQDFIRIETIEFLSRYKIVKVGMLFQKGRQTIKGQPHAPPVLFQWEMRCTSCKQVSVMRTAKTRLLSYIADLHAGDRASYCQACDQIMDQQKEQRWRHESELRLAAVQPNTDRFIESYLDPLKVWSKDTEWRQAFRNMEGHWMFRCDQGQIAARVAEMEYGEFLQTPYWKCLSREVRRLAHYKCRLCNGNGELHVHHNSYQNLGRELKSMRDLICLCADCHETFHAERRVTSVR